MNQHIIDSCFGFTCVIVIEPFGASNVFIRYQIVVNETMQKSSGVESKRNIAFFEKFAHVDGW